MLSVQEPTRKAFEPPAISRHKTMQILSRYVNLKTRNKGTTMSTITFDTHEFIKELKLDDLATKRDLKELEFRLEVRIKDTELKIVESKAELIRWVVGVGLLQTALITALLLKLSAIV